METEEVSKDTIIIIGNGFDVCHGLSSKYSDFRDWLQTNNKFLYETLNRYIDISGDWWNDFERNLAAFNVPKLIDDAPKDYPSRDPRFPPSFYYPANGSFRNIRNQISESFTEWAQTLSCPSTKPRVDIPAADLCISFNYTDTLEKVYGIPENHILYIHGKAVRDNELIFGHSKSHFELEDETKKKYNLYESKSFFVPGTFGDAEYQLTLEISFLDKFPYKQIVKYDSVLIPALAVAKTIWVYGLSFSEVDFQYIEWITEKNPNLRWRVSWHVENDKKRIKNTFDALNVREYEMFYL